MAQRDLIYRLSHQLGVALEYEWTPDEMVDLWPEALDDLREAKEYLINKRLPVPGVVENVLNKVNGLDLPV